MYLTLFWLLYKMSINELLHSICIQYIIINGFISVASFAFTSIIYVHSFERIP